MPILPCAKLSITKTLVDRFYLKIVFWLHFAAYTSTSSLSIKYVLWINKWKKVYAIQLELIVKDSWKKKKIICVLISKSLTNSANVCTIHFLALQFLLKIFDNDKIEKLFCSKYYYFCFIRSVRLKYFCREIVWNFFLLLKKN